VVVEVVEAAQGNPAQTKPARDSRRAEFGVVVPPDGDHLPGERLPEPPTAAGRVRRRQRHPRSMEAEPRATAGAAIRGTWQEEFKSA